MGKPGHFKASSDGNRNPLFYLDANGRVAYADERCCSSLGYARDELVAHAMADLDVIDPDQFRAMVRLHLRSKASRFESVVRRKDGTIFPVEINITDESHGNRTLMKWELHDMSETV